MTRTQGKKKEREVTSSSGVLKGNLKEPPQSAGAGMSKAEKRMRDLRKKLKAIDALLQKEAGGVELDEQQKLKVARMAELMEEMMSMQAEEDGEEEEEEEEEVVVAPKKKKKVKRKVA